MKLDDLGLRATCLLRKAGLAGVPRPVLACVGALCTVLVVFAVWQFLPAGQAASGDFELDAQSVSQQAPAAEDGFQAKDQAGSVTVDVEGSVAAPGVYELAAGARAADAVQAAGGLSESAARAGVNLAQKLEDGTQLYVPSKAEAKSGSVAAAGAAGKASSASTQASSPHSSSAAVNLNTADAAQLQTLPGIGSVLAQAIVDYRTENGPFSSIEGLKKVSGIGDARFSQVKDKVCV